MSVEAAIAQAQAQLPEDLKKEVLNYTTYLLSKQTDEHREETTPAKKRRSGILEGMFVLPLPDDFDQPLEDFRDYAPSCPLRSYVDCPSLKSIASNYQ
jgi:hypothetical protein